MKITEFSEQGMIKVIHLEINQMSIHRINSCERII